MPPWPDPVDVGAASEEILGRGALPAVASAPERARNGFTGGRFSASEVRLHSIHQSQRGSIRECRSCSTLDQSTCGIPLSESTRVGEWRTTADHPTGGFDIRSGIDQCVDHRDIVTAGRPMQWCLVVRTHESRSRPRAHRGSGILADPERFKRLDLSAIES
jgi:hypothetical protein